jgi:hypothetical protein
VHHSWPQLIFTRLRPHSDRQCSSHDLAAPIAPEPPGVGIGLASATLAHELGHACGLLHDNFLDCAAGDPTNLMYCKTVTPDGFPPATTSARSNAQSCAAALMSRTSDPQLESVLAEALQGG